MSKNDSVLRSRGHASLSERLEVGRLLMFSRILMQFGSRSEARLPPRRQLSSTVILKLYLLCSDDSSVSLP